MFDFETTSTVKKMKANKIESIVNSIKELPPLPTTFMKLSELSRNPNSSISDVVKVISLDQAMSIRVLRTCNSPFYGLKKEVTSVAQAAAYLGFNSLLNIATAKVANDLFNVKVKGYDLEEGELYRHSIATALGASIIAKRKHPALKDTVFTGGLLHDIGKLIMARYVSEEYQKIKDIVQNKQISFNEAEKNVLGIDHSELGEKIGKKWKLGNSLLMAIRFHHEPTASDSESPIPHIVHVADALAMMLGIGAGADGLHYAVQEDSMKICGLGENDIDAVIQELLSEMSKAEDALTL